MNDKLSVLVKGSQYIVDLPVPDIYERMGRKGHVTQLKCVMPGISDSYAELEIVTIYNTLRATLRSAMDDLGIKRRDALRKEHEKCMEVLAERGELVYDHNYAREFIYIRYICADNEADWIAVVQNLRAALKTSSAMLSASRFFYMPQENDTTKEPSGSIDELVAKTMRQNNATVIDVGEYLENSYHSANDKKRLIKAGYTMAKNGIMCFFYDPKDATVN